VDYPRLSRAVSHALRHEPWLYEIELDDQGWTAAQDLIAALRAESAQWHKLEVADLERMIAASDKQRHELRDGRIRARYGHSIPGRLMMQPAEPPARLFHGTSPEKAELIMTTGLRPMGRQFVHLSVDLETAQRVGARKSRTPVILEVMAGAAHTAHVPFYRGNESVWLADFVPPAFLQQRDQ
jgi:putative RNA 2'-phosphotransferase